MNPAASTSLIAGWQHLSEAKNLAVSTLHSALDQVQKDTQALIDQSVSDKSKPYGRQVLIESEQLEVMVAKWTRNAPCAPHNHGGSVGAVRILQGESLHRIWQVTNDGLKLVDETIAGPGEILMCGPNMVHSMGDAGAVEPLVTLHMYTQSIDHMLVYDTANDDTLVVNGNCGAWIPTDASGHIRKRIPGYHHTHENT